MPDTDAPVQRLLEYIRLARLQTAAVTAVTPVLGYLTVVGANYHWPIIFLLFCIGSLMHISGFVLNEYTDVDIDRLSPDLASKPLVKGSISMRAAQAVVVVTTIGMYAIAPLVTTDPHPLAFLTLAVALSLCYNRFGKHFPGSDVLLAAWAFMFCLFGAAVAGEGWALSTAARQRVLLVALLGFLQVLFNNAVEGGIKDADHDRIGGARTLATALGVAVSAGSITIPKRFRAFAWSVKIAHMVVVIRLLTVLGAQGHGYRFGGSIVTLLESGGSIIILVLCSIVIFWTLAQFLSVNDFDRSALKQRFALHEIATYFLVPVALLPLIGSPMAIALLLLPFLWFIAMNLILYRQLLEPKV